MAIRCAFLLIVVLALNPGRSLAQGIPHTFTNGSTAYAADVNQNFQYLLSLHGIPRNVRANGIIIGRAILMPGQYFTFSLAITIPASDKPAEFNLVAATGRLYNNDRSIVYNEVSCGGTPYIAVGASWPYLATAPTKPVLVDVAGDLYYIPTSVTTTYTFAPQSYRDDSGACVDNALPSMQAFALVANNPAVTGILTYPFPLPITIDGVSILPTTPP